MDIFETLGEIACEIRRSYSNNLETTAREQRLMEEIASEIRRNSFREKPETNDREFIRDLVDKANQNDIQPEKIQLEVQKKNEVIEKIEELCQENIWL